MRVPLVFYVIGTIFRDYGLSLKGPSNGIIRIDKTISISIFKTAIDRSINLDCSAFSYRTIEIEQIYSEEELFNL